MKSIVLIALFGLCFAAHAFAANEAIDSVPVRKAIDEFVASLSDSDRAEFLRAREEDLPMFHFGAASRIRSRYFVISENSDVRKAFCPADPNAYCDIDEASNAMVRKAWEQIQRSGR